MSTDQQVPELLTTKEAARYLGFQANTLRNARSLGKLAGVKAPLYRKIGTVVRYDRAALDDWLDQFQEQSKCNSIGGAG